MVTKTPSSSMSELANNSNMKNKTNTYYCAQYKLKFRTKGWYDKRVKCGKHKEKAKGFQHKVGLFLHSSLSDQVTLSSHHARAKVDVDEDDTIEINLDRKEVQCGFTRKDRERSKSVFSEDAKLCVKELFNLGVNSATGQIEKSKKVSKHEAAKRIRIKIQKNEEGCWTADNLLNETQVAGLFSRYTPTSVLR